MSMIKKQKEEKLIKKDSSNAQDLYEEAVTLGDILVTHMKKVDPSLENGITAKQYDLFMRLSMYLLKLELFDSSKYNTYQIKNLQRVWKIMAFNWHTFYLNNNLNIDSIYDKSLKEIERIYLEKIRFCEYIFTSTDEQTLFDYLSTPTTIFTIDYVANDYIELSEILDRIKEIKDKPEVLNSKITASILNGYSEYQHNLTHLRDKVDSILKQY